MTEEESVNIKIRAKFVFFYLIPFLLFLAGVLHLSDKFEEYDENQSATSVATITSDFEDFEFMHNGQLFYGSINSRSRHFLIKGENFIVIYKKSNPKARRKYLLNFYPVLRSQDFDTTQVFFKKKFNKTIVTLSYFVNRKEYKRKCKVLADESQIKYIIYNRNNPQIAYPLYGTSIYPQQSLLPEYYKWVKFPTEYTPNDRYVDDQTDEKSYVEEDSLDFWNSFVGKNYTNLIYISIFLPIAILFINIGFKAFSFVLRMLLK